MHTLHLTVEVSGCPVCCSHCWALGGRRPHMPLSDIERALYAFALAAHRRH